MSRVEPFWIDCADERLLAMLHRTVTPASIGVLIVVGGPQYRVGSHRQFVLLARHLCDSGFPVLRFDYRGMGDSDGAPREFAEINDDIAAAVDSFMSRQPGLERVVIWGLCDAASAALFYASGDPRIAGLVLVNPWAYTEVGESRTLVRHYYINHLFDPRLWRRILRLEFDYVAAARSLLGHLWVALGAGRTGASGTGPELKADLPTRMADGLERFSGPVLLLLSGDDLVADEFRDVAGGRSQWRELMEQPRISRRELPDANHTFSQQSWRDEVAEHTAAWLQESLAARQALLPAKSVG